MHIKLVAIVALLVFVSSSALAFDVDFELSCPVAVAAGSNVVVTVRNIENWEPDSGTLERFMSGFVVNANDTLGGAGVYGPYNRKLATPVDIPAGTNCSFDWCSVPGTHPSFKVTLGKAPNAPGKIGMALLNFLTPDGNEISSGDCLFTVTPAPIQ